MRINVWIYQALVCFMVTIVDTGKAEESTLLNVTLLHEF